MQKCLLFLVTFSFLSFAVESKERACNLIEAMESTALVNPGAKIKDDSKIFYPTGELFLEMPTLHSVGATVYYKSGLPFVKYDGVAKKEEWFYPSGKLFRDKNQRLFYESGKLFSKPDVSPRHLLYYENGRILVDAMGRSFHKDGSAMCVPYLPCNEKAFTIALSQGWSWNFKVEIIQQGTILGQLELPLSDRFIDVNAPLFNRDVWVSNDYSPKFGFNWIAARIFSIRPEILCPYLKITGFDKCSICYWP